MGNASASNKCSHWRVKFNLPPLGIYDQPTKKRTQGLTEVSHFRIRVFLILICTNGGTSYPGQMLLEDDEAQKRTLTLGTMNRLVWQVLTGSEHVEHISNQASN